MQNIKIVEKEYEDSFMGAIHEEYERELVLFPESGKYFDKTKFTEELARTIYFHQMENIYYEYL